MNLIVRTLKVWILKSYFSSGQVSTAEWNKSLAFIKLIQFQLLNFDIILIEELLDYINIIGNQNQIS